MTSRRASKDRATKETTIAIELDLDGAGRTEVSTGLPFFDHMLEQLGKHASFDLSVKAEGDLHIDAHHTVEDVGIVLGGCLAEALGDKAGIRRFASMLLPLDEALIAVALDISGRPYLAYGLDFAPDTPGLGSPPFDPQLAEEFWRAFVDGGEHHAAHPAARGEEHPPHARGQLQGGRPLPARRGARRGRWHSVDQGELVSGRRVAVLDYGIGNLRSAEKALQHVGAAARLVTDASEVEAADAVVLPGVGAFGACAQALRESGLEEPARQAIAAGVPFFGVCVGFQLLYEVVGREPRSGRPRRLRGNGGRAASWGEAPADAMERAGADRFRRARAARRSGPTTLGVLRAFLRAARRCRDGRFVRLRGTGGRHGEPGRAVGSSVPSGEVGHGRPRTPGQLRGPSGLMELLPAIDLRGGEAVRLTQGDFEREARYGDPAALAARYIEAGAAWIHVVDLEAARTGVSHERGALQRIVELASAAGVRVQTGGGIRSEGSAGDLLESGVSRVVLGTAALEDPDLAPRCARRWPGRVAVGLDYRVGEDGVAEALGHGWSRGSGRAVAELLAWWAGEPIGAVVATAVARDGMLEGPDLAGLAALLVATPLPVVASGGVGSLADLAALADLAGCGRGLEGAIVGKAIVDGRFSVEEGIAACAASA